MTAARHRAKVRREGADGVAWSARTGKTFALAVGIGLLVVLVGVAMATGHWQFPVYALPVAAVSILEGYFIDRGRRRHD